MERPKRMVNMVTGIHGSMGPVWPIPTTLPNQPHWKTAIRIPTQSADDAL